MKESSFDEFDYFPDTTKEQILTFNALLKMREEGLYFMYNGEPQTPHTIWFGIHFYKRHEGQLYGGLCYTMYDNALRPVYDRNGVQYRVPAFRNVTASYDGININNFRKE